MDLISLTASLLEAFAGQSRSDKRPSVRKDPPRSLDMQRKLVFDALKLSFDDDGDGMKYNGFIPSEAQAVDAPGANLLLAVFGEPPSEEDRLSLNFRYSFHIDEFGAIFIACKEDEISIFVSKHREGWEKSSHNTSLDLKSFLDSHEESPDSDCVYSIKGREAIVTYDYFNANTLFLEAAIYVWQQESKAEDLQRITWWPNYSIRAVIVGALEGIANGTLALPTVTIVPREMRRTLMGKALDFGTKYSGTIRSPFKHTDEKVTREMMTSAFDLMCEFLPIANFGSFKNAMAPANPGIYYAFADDDHPFVLCTQGERVVVFGTDKTRFEETLESDSQLVYEFRRVPLSQPVSRGLVLCVYMHFTGGDMETLYLPKYAKLAEVLERGILLCTSPVRLVETEKEVTESKYTPILDLCKSKLTRDLKGKWHFRSVENISWSGAHIVQEEKFFFHLANELRVKAFRTIKELIDSHAAGAIEDIAFAYSYHGMVCWSDGKTFRLYASIDENIDSVQNLVSQSPGGAAIVLKKIEGFSLCGTRHLPVNSHSFAFLLLTGQYRRNMDMDVEPDGFRKAVHELCTGDTYKNRIRRLMALSAANELGPIRDLLEEFITFDQRVSMVPYYGAHGEPEHERLFEKIAKINNLRATQISDLKTPDDVYFGPIDDNFGLLTVSKDRKGIAAFTIMDPERDDISFYPAEYEDGGSISKEMMLVAAYLITGGYAAMGELELFREDRLNALNLVRRMNKELHK